MVDLHAYVCRQSLPRIGDLRPYQTGERAAHVVRRHQQLAELDGDERRSYEVEHLFHLPDEFRTGGEQQHVGVAAGVALMEISGAYDRIAAGRGFDVGELAVDLQALDPVDDFDSGIAHLAAPVDIALLVEAGQKFDDHGDPLAVVGGRYQRLDHLGVLCQAVKRNLDGLDLGRHGGFTQQLKIGFERMVRHMDEPVRRGDYLEYPGDAVRLPHGSSPVSKHVKRFAQGIFEVISAAVGEGHQVLVIMVSPAWHDGVVGRKLELPYDPSEQFTRHLAVVHDSQRLSGTAGRKAPLDLLHLAFVEVVVNLHLGVPGELEGVGVKLVEVQPDEEFAHHQPQYVVKGHHACVAVGVVGETVITAHTAGGDRKHGV